MFPNYFCSNQKEEEMGFITQHEVIQALKDEKSMAWDAFFTAYVPLIRLHGKDCGIKDEYLDDLVQDVMISVIKISKKFQYDPCKGRFRDFLKKIIRAKSMDILRRHYKKDAPLQHLVGETEEIVEAMEDVSLLPGEMLDKDFYDEWKNIFIKNCLKILRNDINIKHYQIYFLLEFQKYSVTEVAKYYNLPRVTIYSIRSRTEKKLSTIARNLISHLPEDDFKHFLKS